MRLSIRSRLALFFWGAALFAFAVGSASLLLYERLTLERRAQQAMAPYAELVSVGAESAVAFRDPVRAQEILDTLRANPQILEAELVLGDGELLARYGARPTASQAPSPSRPDGVILVGNAAELLQRLKDGASLRLVMSLDQLARQADELLQTFAAVVVALLALSGVLLALIERTVVAPISTLAKAVDRVRSGPDYSQRVPASGADEVGRLGASFNAMMGAIEERDRALSRLSVFQQTILDNIAHGIVSTDPDGLVTSFNPAAERLLGYSASEAVGKLVPTAWQDPEEMAQRAKALTEELGESVAAGFEVFTARPRRHLQEEREWTFIRRDGARVPVLLTVSALREKDGQVTGFVGLVRDLSEQRMAEAALQAKTAELEGYFTNALDLLCIADTDGNFRRLNPAWESTLGYSVSELEGRAFVDFVHEEDADATLSATARLATQQAVLSFANRFRNKRGAYRWLEWRSFASGQRIYAVARDITDRKQAEEEVRRLNQELEQRVADRTAQLESANRELEAFAYNVSHDLRAPLRHIDGLLGLLKKRIAASLDEEGRRYMATISEEAKRGGALIDDLLDFLRIGRVELHPSPIDLDALVREVRQSLAAESEGRVVEWRVGALPVVVGDRSMMRVVMQNLLSNALKFTRPRAAAVIEVGCRLEQEREAIIFVRDNGVGFDMQYVEKLFGVLQRLHGVHEFEGTGFGLAAVRRVVSRHGGRAWAEGALDRGATFYIALPRAPATSRPLSTAVDG